MRVLGVDPGSKSWDIFGLDVEKNSICIDRSIKTEEVMKNPDSLLQLIQDVEPFDYLVAPSGFGLPLKRVQNLTDEDINYLILKRQDSSSILGLKNILHKLKEKRWNAYVIPSVKHLPTVKTYRKINKIDLGTADKLCSVVVGIHDIMERNNISCKEVNFIMIELGSAFSAIIAVERGQIIDGIGGSNLMGFKACGSLDAELAYLMGSITKQKICKGGVDSIAGEKNYTPREIFFHIKDDNKCKIAIQSYIDNIVKGVYAIKSTFNQRNQPTYILLSGRLANEKYIEMILDEKLRTIAPVRIMKTYGKIAKRGAQGAAFIAEGLNGGPSQQIIENLHIKDAKGTILDNIYLPIEFDH